MSKRTTFTTITPLPAGVSRETVLDFLHNHLEMIDLNPLIKERHPIPAPDHSPEDERRCVWYSLTDEINYMPGVSYASSDVSYTCAFHDLPQGLQTHCYAPMGLDIRDRWTIGGTLPGEPPEPRELGLDAPKDGLYLREDVDMRCNVIMAGFVKKTLKKSHGSLVEKLKGKAAAMHTVGSGNAYRASSAFDLASGSQGSHGSQGSQGSQSWQQQQPQQPPHYNHYHQQQQQHHQQQPPQFRQRQEQQEWKPPPPRAHSADPPRKTSPIDHPHPLQSAGNEYHQPRPQPQSQFRPQHRHAPSASSGSRNSSAMTTGTTESDVSIPDYNTYPDGGRPDLSQRGPHHRHHQSSASVSTVHSNQGYDQGYHQGDGQGQGWGQDQGQGLGLTLDRDGDGNDDVQWQSLTTKQQQQLMKQRQAQQEEQRREAREAREAEQLRQQKHMQAQTQLEPVEMPVEMPGETTGGGGYHHSLAPGNPYADISGKNPFGDLPGAGGVRRDEGHPSPLVPGGGGGGGYGVRHGY